MHPATTLRLRTTLPLLALCVAVLAVYWAGLHGSFIFDDVGAIIDNALLRRFDGSLQSLVAAATSGTSSPLGRPVSMASFALNFFVLGNEPFPFKLVNLLIHIANAMLVFVLVRQLWRRLGRDTTTTRSHVAATAVAAAWALHPMNLTPVLLVVQRMTSLAAFFTLAALVLYLHGRAAKPGKRAFPIAVAVFICWPAAVLSKETGLLAPLYVLLCEWLVLGSVRAVPAKAKWLAAGVTAGILVVLCWLNWSFLMAGYRVREFTLAERLMTEARVLWMYVRQLLLPAPDGFALFHDDIALSRGLLSPVDTLLAILGWLAVVAVAFRWRRRAPLFAFAVLWFLASHLLESTLLPLELAYEHRNYLASFGLFLWLASVLFPEREDAEWYVPRLALVASFVFLCGLLTSIRSLQWADEFQRTQVEVSKHPASARANYQAAVAAMQRTYEVGGGNPMAYQMAHVYYQRAADLDSAAKAPLIGLVYLDCLAGAPKDAGVRSMLLKRFSSTPFTFGDRSVVLSLSALLVENRLCMDDREVRGLINAALSNPSADGSMRGMIYSVAMDHALARLHSVPLALTYAEAAVASDPGSFAFRVNLVRLLLRANRVDDARREYMIMAKAARASRDRAVLTELTTIFERTETSADTDGQGS